MHTYKKTCNCGGWCAVCQGCGEVSDERSCAECKARLKHEEDTHLTVNIEGETRLKCRLGWGPDALRDPNGTFWKVTQDEQEVTCLECMKRCQNWCDYHEKVHVDIKAEHCAKGSHCTGTTASCAAEETVDDHGSRCCICKAALVDLEDVKYQAPVDTSSMPVPQVRNVQTF